MDAIPKGTPGFHITRQSGFHVTFENGWTVSVQFGAGCYADHYDASCRWDDRKIGEVGAATAECAVWPRVGEMLCRWDGDTVSNRSTPAEVLELLNWAASQKEE